MKKFYQAALSRRAFLGSAASASVLATMPLVGRVFAQGDAPLLVNSIRSLSNPYHAAWNAGGEAFASRVGLDYVTLVTEGDSEKGVADIRGILARTGGNAVVNVDPNDAADARPIVEACVEAGAHVMTQWNKPDDLHPWDMGPNYVAHMSFNGEQYGRTTAEVLFEAMGGQGGILALGGTLSNTVAIQRRAGLEAALADASGVELLDYQVGDWQSSKAYDIVNTWLTRFSGQFGGIWCANDDMAIGALEALRVNGMSGQVAITGIDGIETAVQAVIDGEMVATVSWDPFWQGSIGLAIPLRARLGEIDPESLGKDKREFYAKGVVVTAENAQAFYEANFVTAPELDVDDIWARYAGPIE
ncbi:sugar ABC transporter substrate-binding protein [Tropicimonas isoalkanivorans]|uniref:Ribose transport system substrate-binding protein n=1 Tax=Tropicimonas isoalkanivorans TaxID=441112 RepID=A0A1I1MQD0_9RHOB|nr:sugar ABC transporter substrate-binding protein [Tropicimonas isoalkanivorans]SFC87687.1 ribose transport system substrate-binding protein [Tropicimonas isoalkanivorans]